MRAGVLAAVAIVLASAPAAADPVKVKIVEIGGDVAYLEPGEAAGLTVGSVVTIGGAKLEVIAVTRTTAAVRIGKARLEVGDKGVATAAKGGAVAGARQLAKPRRLDDFRGQWPTAVVPAVQQHPEPVPLGAGRAPGAVRMTAWTQLFAAAGKGGGDGSLEVGTRLAYEPWRERPLGVDLDVAARVTARGRTGARVPLRVAAAQVRWGAADDPRVAVGRLRWASSATGMLDGARVSARFAGVEIAAFGGIVPDPIDGVPEPGATRFGAELAWDDDASRWPAHAVVTAQGSTWNGALDERRITAAADVSHADLTAGAWAEAQQFAAGNPWNARPLELTSAGVDLGWRRRGRHFSVGASMLRPERSRRLDAALPPEWLCAREPLPGEQAEECTGGDFDLTGTASSGLSGARWSLDAGGAAGLHHGVTKEGDGSGFVLAGLRILPGHGRLLLGASGGVAGPIAWESAEGGVAFAPSHAVDVSVRYRFELLAYRGALDTFATHEVITDLDWAVRRTVDASLSLGLAAGDDRSAAFGLATLIWRPWP